MAATLTLSHPQSNPQSPSNPLHPQTHSPTTTNPSSRVIQPYERRCRSTCSITLQGLNKPNNDSPTDSGQNYPLRSQLPQQQQQQRQPNNSAAAPSLYLPLRRSSEGETNNVTWNSHSKVPQLLASLTDSRCSVVPTSSTSHAAFVASDSFKDDQTEVRQKSLLVA